MSLTFTCKEPRVDRLLVSDRMGVSLYGTRSSLYTSAQSLVLLGLVSNKPSLLSSNLPLAIMCVLLWGSLLFFGCHVPRKVVGGSLDADETPVATVMTPNPLWVNTTDSAMEALGTMLEKHFRHLPVRDFAVSG